MNVPDLKIELMQLEDLEDVSQIEIEGGLSVWGKQNYSEEIKRGDSILYVARTRDLKNKISIVVGFVVARLITPTVEILNIATAQNQRKKGIGRRLLQQVIFESENRNYQACWLEVRESNDAARKFYSKMGFSEVGRRRSYYTNPSEDAILLSLDFRK
jgi:ribosomal-protein-alanine N-acetyltransferase